MTANFNSDQGKRTTEWTLYGVCKGCGVAGSSMQDSSRLLLHHIGCPRPGREDIRVVRAASDETGELAERLVERTMTSKSEPIGWGGRMVVFVCPCGYYDVDEPRLCPECGVGLTMEMDVEPAEQPDPFKQSLHQAVTQGLMRVTQDGTKFELTDAGRELGRRTDEDGGDA